jgi:hypothetical protein
MSDTLIALLMVLYFMGYFIGFRCTTQDGEQWCEFVVAREKGDEQ